MPNIKSAVKRARTSEAARKINASNRKALLTARRAFLAVVAAGDKAKALEAFNVFSSKIDKSAKKGVISKNSADRRKSRAYAKVAALA